jgi:hypothetical protein
MFSILTEAYRICDISIRKFAGRKFHFIRDDTTMCITLAKQTAIASYLRFNIIECNCHTKKHNMDNVVYFQSDCIEMLYGCGCSLDKFDVLESILNSD